jgi:serine/threonine protein kinase
MTGSPNRLNPDYFPPELIRNPQGGDIRSDLYSLGCVLYFLLIGRPPFQDAGPGQVLSKHQSAEPVPVTTLRADLPPVHMAI